MLVNRISRRAAFGFLWASMFDNPAFAESSTMDRIRRSGMARVAIDLTIPPYAMMDQNMQPTGSEVDTARLFCEDLGVSCEFVSVTSAARIPSLVTGKADLIISLMSMTSERSKVIGFSLPYGAVISVVAGPAEPKVSGYADLVGKRIVATRGSTNDRTLTGNMLPGTTVMRFDDDAASVAALVVQQADYFATAPDLLPAVNLRRPERPIVPLFSIGRTLYAVGLPLGDAPLKTWADRWVQTNLRNGKLGAIFEGWHHAPLPEDVLRVGS